MDAPGPSGLSSFPAEVFHRRRERALDALGDGSLVLPAAPIRYRSGDTEYAYRPDSDLYYLTGFTEPEAVAVLRGGAEEDRFVLFVRERDEDAERWSGPRLGPEAAGERAGADAAYPLGELEERLPKLLRSGRRIHYRLDGDLRTRALVLRALEWGTTRGARKGVGPRGIVDPGEILNEMRMRKGPEELERIRRAAAVTVEVFREMLGTAEPGMGEWELEALLDGGFRRRGGRGPAYGTIVGSGTNACVLHYVENRDRLARGDLVLVDAGAEMDLYAADVTRTFPASGCFSGEQRALYEVVARAQRAAVDAVEPGAPVAGVHRAAVRVLVEGLVELGILEGEVDERVAEEAYKPWYPHQTSHWLGLDVHDPGDYARGGEDRPLEAGMVLTVEPGLYVPPGAEGAAAPFAGLGIRIEDDVVVTPDGHENLTEELPVEPDAVEELMRR